MKKQSLFKKLFKKKDSVPEEVEGERIPTLMEKPGKEVENQPEFNGMPPIDIPLPEFDEKEIFGELDVYINKEKVATHKLESPTRIGRDPAQADVIIPELIVSKFHCTIYLKDGAVYVRDNKSTNGTYVYNQKINLQAIEDQTVIGLGKKGTVQIKFRRGV